MFEHCRLTPSAKVLRWGLAWEEWGEREEVMPEGGDHYKARGLLQSHGGTEEEG